MRTVTGAGRQLVEGPQRLLDRAPPGPSRSQRRAGTVQLVEQLLERREAVVALENHVHRVRHALSDLLEQPVHRFGHRMPMVVEDAALTRRRLHVRSTRQVHRADAMRGQGRDERLRVVAQVAAVGHHVVEVQEQIRGAGVQEAKQPLPFRSIAGRRIDQRCHVFHHGMAAHVPAGTMDVLCRRLQRERRARRGGEVPQLDAAGADECEVL